MPAPPLRILLAGDAPAADARVAMEAAGFEVRATGLGGIDPAEVARAGAVVIDVAARTLNTAQSLCRRWRIELGERFVPIVWLTGADVSAAAGLDSGADAVLRQTDAAEQLVPQVKALLRV
ncbi:MAG TPA: hypothetical protein VKE74_13985, partial [Gemmataceae bacterium]|nr:hypothetical protein [Gemmataceae bacterium]